LLTGAAQLLGLAGIWYLAGLYSPAAFGFFQIHLSCAMLVILVASLRFELSLLTSKDDRDVPGLFAHCAVSNLAVAAVGLIVCSVLAVRQLLAQSCKIRHPRPASPWRLTS